MADKSEMQIEAYKKPKRKAPRTAFKPGQSGNPKGRPVDQEYKDALALLKAKSPELMQKAIDMGMAGSEKVICALINKICPEMIKFDPENPLRLILSRQLGSAVEE